MYGGAAGGGKSEALLAGAAQYVEDPGYAALLFRRTYSDLSLPGALMDRAYTWWGSTAAKWSEEKKTWTFPSGATITFAFMEKDNDRYRYQGSEYQYVGFDELTQFSELQYSYLASRLRRKEGSVIPTRLRAASNPGGRGHEWVKQYFIIEGAKDGRVFVPAKLQDNPHLDQKSYRNALNRLDPTTRAQLLSGDWNAHHSGALFDRSSIDLAETPDFVERMVRYWDLAAARPSHKNDDPDWTVGTLMARGTNNTGYFILDIVRFRGNPGEVQDSIQKTAWDDTIDVEIFIEQEPGSAGLHLIDHYKNKVLRAFAFQGVRASGDKATRANPMAIAAKNGMLHVTAGDWHGTFFDEIESFPTGNHDDQLDSASGAFLQLAAGGELRRAAPSVRHLFNYR